MNENTRCPLHGRSVFATEADADDEVARINRREGRNKVKAWYSRGCGSWHVSVRRGRGAIERQRARYADG